MPYRGLDRLSFASFPGPNLAVVGRPVGETSDGIAPGGGCGGQCDFAAPGVAVAVCTYWTMRRKSSSFTPLTAAARVTPSRGESAPPPPGGVGVSHGVVSLCLNKTAVSKTSCLFKNGG